MRDGSDDWCSESVPVTALRAMDEVAAATMLTPAWTGDEELAGLEPEVDLLRDIS